MEPGGSETLAKLTSNWTHSSGRLEKPETGPIRKSRVLAKDDRVPPGPSEAGAAPVRSVRVSAAAKAREAERDRCYVAAARSLEKQLQLNPKDQKVTEEMRKGMTNLGAARTYFIPSEPKRNRAHVRRANITHVPAKKEPEVVEAVPDELDDTWRKKSDLREFEAYWKEIAPELKEIMKKEPPEHMQLLKDVCWTFFPNIKGMFIYYAALDADVYAKMKKLSKQKKELWTEQRGASQKVSMVKTVSVVEFTRFLKDTQLVTRKPSPNSIVKADAELIFSRVNWERNEDGQQVEDDDNPDRELTGHEWLHSIIRIAHKIPSLQGVPVHERVQRCLQTMMLPKAGKVDMSAFDERFASPHVKKVLEERQFKLMTLFRFYSAGNGDDDDMFTMASTELLELCRAHSVLNKYCPAEVILTSHVLAQAQAADGAEAEASNDCDLDYDQFLWAIGRIADIWVPDRYIKLSTKLSLLLDHIDAHAALAQREDHQDGDEADITKEMLGDLDRMPSVSAGFYSEDDDDGGEQDGEGLGDEEGAGAADGQATDRGGDAQLPDGSGSSASTARPPS